MRRRVLTKSCCKETLIKSTFHFVQNSFDSQDNLKNTPIEAEKHEYKMKSDSHETQGFNEIH